MSRRNARHLHKFYDADAQGPVEAAQARRRRLDARADDQSGGVAVERSDAPANLERAAKRLRADGGNQKVLKVPQWNMAKAAEAMRKAGVSGVVSNLSGTRKRRISAKR